ncbi:MAG: amino acid permease [Candidatus Jordarchaeales archaeon]
MDASSGQQSKLKPSLSLFDATAISIGAIIGAGIFIVTGIAAGLAGSALVVSMLVAAVIALLTALSIAELTAWQPLEGSIYEYAYRLISPSAGFLAGWIWILSNMFAGAAVSLGFAYYLATLTPVLPANLIAAITCMAFTTLNFIGIRQSALANNVLVTAKLLILIIFIAVGLGCIRVENFSRFEPFGAGVLYGAFYIFFAYGGFARVAVVAEEVKNARKNVPRAILLSLVISTLVYILVGIVAVGLAGASGLSSSKSPLSDAISVTGSTAAVYIVSVGGLLATASVLLTSILGVSRMAYAMARRRDLPQAMSKLHARFGTPYYSIWIIGFLMTLLALFVDLSRIVAISTFALLFYYALANASALRIGKRLYPRVVPALGLATCLILIVFVPLEAWIMGSAGLAAGVAFHLVKRRFST